MLVMISLSLSYADPEVNFHMYDSHVYYCNNYIILTCLIDITIFFACILVLIQASSKELKGREQDDDLGEIKVFNNSTCRRTP